MRRNQITCRLGGNRQRCSLTWLSALHSIVHSNLAFFLTHTCYTPHTHTYTHRLDSALARSEDLYLFRPLADPNTRNPVMYQHFESTPCVFIHWLFVPILTLNTLGICLPNPSERQKLLTLFYKSADELLIV